MFFNYSAIIIYFCELCDTKIIYKKIIKMLRLPITYEISTKKIADNDDSVICLDSLQSSNEPDDSVICLDSPQSSNDQDDSVICLDSPQSLDDIDESVICLDSVQPLAYSSSTPAPGSPEFLPSSHQAEWSHLSHSDQSVYSPGFFASPSRMLSYSSPQSSFNSTQSHQLVDLLRSPQLSMWYITPDSPQTPPLPQWPQWPQSPQTTQLMQSPQSPQWSPLPVTHPFENDASMLISNQTFSPNLSGKNVSMQSNLCNWSPSATFIVFTIADYDLDGNLLEQQPSKRFKYN
jgi:hypothetical protein